MAYKASVYPSNKTALQQLDSHIEHIASVWFDQVGIATMLHTKNNGEILMSTSSRLLRTRVELIVRLKQIYQISNTFRWSLYMARMFFLEIAGPHDLGTTMTTGA